MDGLVFIGLLLAGWFLIAPLLGIIGFSKANRLERELDALRRAQGILQGSQQPVHPEPGIFVPSAMLEPASDDSVSPSVIPASETPPGPVSADHWERHKAATLQRPSASDWEQLIAANWMIWIGGLTVAIGGLLLVRFVWEAGLLNDVARVSLGGAFGLVLVGLGFQAGKWPLVQSGSGATQILPSILAAAGITVLNGAVFTAGALYGLIPPLIALASYLLVAMFAVGLAMRFGRWVAALGLVGAYFGPLFTGADDGSVTLLLAYAAGVTGGALTLVRLRGWPQLILIALIGAGFWGLSGHDASTPDFVLPVYALGLAGMGIFFGLRAARDAFEVNLAKPLSVIEGVLAKDASLGAAFLFTLLGGALIWLDMMVGFTLPALGALAGFAGAAIMLAWRYKGYVWLAPIGGGLVMAGLLFWPSEGDLLVKAVLAVVAGFGGLGTWLALNPPAGQTRAPELAATAALVPAGALFVPVSGLYEGVTGFWWGYAALCVAVLFVAVLEVIKRESASFEGNEKTAAAFALGALLSSVLAPFAFLSGLWLGSAMAVLALGICAVHLRFPLPVLRLCGPLAIAGTLALLMRPWLLEGTVISTTPIFNELLFGFGIAIGSLSLGAWLSRATKQLYQSAVGGALILGFALIGLEIRHLAQAGDLYSMEVSLGEASGYAVTYLGMAASFSWRFSARGRLFALAEHIAAMIGVLAVLVGLFLLPIEPALGWPIANLLFAVLAMPGLLMAAYASVLRSKDRAGEASFWGWGAIVLGFIWITLETRRMLVGVDVFSGASGGGIWAYSVAWMIYAVSLLLWGTLRRRSSARFASLAILLLAIGKGFLFDLALLEGVVRAASFIGLGGCLIGIALFYQRYVFGREDVTA